MIKQEFFLGGTSPSGFCSKFIERIKADGFYTYILKGGPGTGKSTLMKKIVSAFDKSPLTLYYCSSDTRSLDAVAIEDKKIIVVDGTAPHVFEAIYPGVSQEIINLGEYWDGEKLKSQGQKIRCSLDENQKLHSRVKCYIKALASLNDDIYAIGDDTLNYEKLDSYIARLCKKAVSGKPSDKRGTIKYNQLSAFTTDGYMTKPVNNDYSIYLLKDDLFAGSDYFLRKVCEYILSCGYDVNVSECTMHHVPIYEHIFSEDAKIAFMSSNFFNQVEGAAAAEVNFKRFYNKELVNAKKSRLAFDRKAAVELASEAAGILSSALTVHDELEKYYIDAVDFKELESLSAKLIEKIKNQ